MSKLCSLKDVVPGSTIEVPAPQRAKEGETAVILSLEYSADKSMLFSSIIRPFADGFQQTELAGLDPETKIALVDDPALRKLATAGFIANKLKFPYFGMSMGCDPEIFAVHGDGKIFPAWEYMPDEESARIEAKSWLDRKFEYKVLSGTPTFSTGAQWIPSNQNSCPQRVPAYWDGAQAEFAPYAKACLETLHYGTRTGLLAVLEAAKAKDPGAKLTIQNVVELPAETLAKADDKFIQFRCSRSYNVYDDPGDGVQNAREYKYRCAGGHIHVGFTRKFTTPGTEQIVRGLDGILGVAGVSLAAWIDNPERRHIYGRAGEFRLPAHGVEYRVLSNFWLSHPALAMLVFELARAVVRLAESGLYNLCWVAEEAEIRDVINNCDVAGARRILRRNLAVLAGLFQGIWPGAGEPWSKMRALGLKTLLEGIDVSIKDPSDIEGNWKLNKPDEWQVWCRGKGDNWQSLTEGVK